MSTEISTRISPEGLEIANAYLELGNIPAVSIRLKVDEGKISEYLLKREVKQYVDLVYLDTGYRNRGKLAETLDLLIEKKLEEAEESEQAEEPEESEESEAEESEPEESEEVVEEEPEQEAEEPVEEAEEEPYSLTFLHPA